MAHRHNGPTYGVEGERHVPSYPKHPRAYVTFQIRLPPDLKRQLEEYAFRTGQSQISVVTTALEGYLRQVQQGDHSGRSNQAEGSSSPTDPDDVQS